MKKYFSLWMLMVPVFLPCCSPDLQDNGSAPEFTPLSVFADAFKNQQSNIQVMQEGAIITVLSDDLDGDRHQRMIVRLGNDQTLLIAHNIDLAPRVPDPKVGKTLRFYGEYEWNDQGGVIHWTHGDPGSDHIAGWLEYEGKRYGGDGATVTSRGPGTPETDNDHWSGVLRRVNRRTAGIGETLFDLKGRCLGRSLTRQGAGVRLLKFPDGRHGSIKFSHE